MQPGHPPRASDIDIDDDDELPPPYTPAANLGEQTVGLGPQRPFQPPPPQHPSQQQPGWQPQIHQPLQPLPTGSGAYVRPDLRTGLAPWQTRQQYQYPHRQKGGGGGLLGALFDTVCDITDAVLGPRDERTGANQAANAGAYAAPSSSRSVYAAPPGPPGQSMPPAPPGPPGQPSLPPRPASTPPRPPPSSVPDDGSPTRTPTPGHPLLRDGRLLVYPKDHFCGKCKNTGYKNYDPSHPCRKCWDKYARSYTGVLTYTPWSSSSNDPRMQRPLPKFRAPRLSAGASSSALRSSYSPQPPQSPYSPRGSSDYDPQYMRSPGQGPSYYVADPFSPGSPPPNAITVAPGDPRLGGRLCFRCGGSGVRTILWIDEVTCDTCGGSGRVWM